MNFGNSSTDIPLGVECAWPMPGAAQPPSATARLARRLADAFRRFVADLQAKPAAIPAR